MAQKVESGKGRMRHWDPIFAALWAHVGEIEISYQAVADGVKVSENAKSAEFTCAAQIIQVRPVNAFDRVVFGGCADVGAHKNRDR